MTDGPGAIEVEGITFRYGVTPRDAPPTLDGLTFSVRKGEVFGVLGPNGAGKTTLMKLLSTVLLPASGRLRILGRDVPREEEDVRALLGVSFAEFERAFAWRLTGRQNLAYFGAYYRMSKPHLRARVETVLERVGLTDKGDTLFQYYSTGMKHRLSLARALLAEPQLLLLDEPTSGLDATTSHELGRTIRSLTEDGVTVVYTTHRLEEAAALCDRVLILKDGRQAAMAAPWELARLAADVMVIEFTVKGVLPEADALSQLPGVRSAQVTGRASARVQAHDLDAAMRAILAWLHEHALEIAAWRTSEANLTDAFLAITEGRLDAAPDKLEARA